MDYILQYYGVTKAYGSVPVLNNFTFSVPKGKIVGLLGPNGSGKTTLIKLAAGILHQNAGGIVVDGMNVGEKTKSLISYLPERPYFNRWMKTVDMLDYFCDFYEDFDRARAEEMLARLQIDITVPMKNLSKGTKEKVQLVMVMARRAKLYLLDEPIAGVDPAARDYILQTIISNYAPDATVIISTHLISDVENFLNDFIFLQNGTVILSGDAKQTMQEQGKTLDELFREVFKC